MLAFSFFLLVTWLFLLKYLHLPLRELQHWNSSFQNTFPSRYHIPFLHPVLQRVDLNLTGSGFPTVGDNPLRKHVEQHSCRIHTVSRHKTLWSLHPNRYFSKQWDPVCMFYMLWEIPALVLTEHATKLCLYLRQGKSTELHRYWQSSSTAEGEMVIIFNEQLQSTP